MYRRYVHTIHTRKCNVEAWLKFFCVVMPANWRALINFGIFGVDIVDRLHLHCRVVMAKTECLKLLANYSLKVVCGTVAMTSSKNSRTSSANKTGLQCSEADWKHRMYVLVLAGREQVGNTMVERVS